MTARRLKAVVAGGLAGAAVTVTGVTALPAQAIEPYRAPQVCRYVKARWYVYPRVVYIDGTRYSNGSLYRQCASNGVELDPLYRRTGWWWA